MGSTTRGYPYPEAEDFVKDGASAIQGLAEAVDADTSSLDGPDLIVLTSSATDPGSDNRPNWDFSSPIRVRGAWTTHAGNHIITPPSPGWFFCAASWIPIDVGGVGGGSGFNTYSIYLQTMIAGNDPATDSTNWMRSAQNIADGETSRLHVSGIVEVNADANRGIQITLNPGSIPGLAADTSARFSIIRLGGL